VTTRNARFQQWQALLTNRTKRTRSGQFLVQGVRPVNLALEHDWPIATVLHAPAATLSSWARGVLDQVGPLERAEVATELLGELGEKPEASPELLLVAHTQPDDLTRVQLTGDAMALVVDRPANPGNLGTLIRAADAFGLAGVVVTGHATDVYDPRTVRASTGSLFAIPVVRTGSHRDVLGWVSDQPGTRPRVVGTDESARILVENTERAICCSPREPRAYGTRRVRA
jgi:TrmH family RNA methyltransferase